MMVQYKIFHQDDEMMVKVIVSHMKIRCTETLNWLRERLKHTFYQGLEFLSEPDLLLEFIKVPRTSFDLGLRPNPQAVVSERIQKDRSHFEHIDHENVLKWKYTNHFSFVILKNVNVT